MIILISLSLYVRKSHKKTKKKKKTNGEATSCLQDIRKLAHVDDLDLFSSLVIDVKVIGVVQGIILEVVRGTTAAESKPCIQEKKKKKGEGEESA